MSRLPNQPCGAHISVLQTCLLETQRRENQWSPFWLRDDHPESLLKEKPMDTPLNENYGAVLILLVNAEFCVLCIKAIFEGFEKHTQEM